MSTLFTLAALGGFIRLAVWADDAYNGPPAGPASLPDHAGETIPQSENPIPDPPKAERPERTP